MRKWYLVLQQFFRSLWRKAKEAPITALIVVVCGIVAIVFLITGGIIIGTAIANSGSMFGPIVAMMGLDALLGLLGKAISVVFNLSLIAILVVLATILTNFFNLRSFKNDYRNA